MVHLVQYNCASGGGGLHKSRRSQHNSTLTSQTAKEQTSLRSNRSRIQNMMCILFYSCVRLIIFLLTIEAGYRSYLVSSQKGSTISPTLFYDGRNALLIFSLVLLVQLSCLAIGWTIRIWFIQ